MKENWERHQCHRESSQCNIVENSTNFKKQLDIQTWLLSSAKITFLNWHRNKEISRQAQCKTAHGHQAITAQDI